MYLAVCLLVHVIYLNLISCQDTGYKCENTCHNERLPDDGQWQEQWKHGNAIWLRLKKQIKSLEAVKLTLKKALYVWRKIWNSGRVFKLPVLKHNLDDEVPAKFRSGDVHEARTFGIRRRMQLFLWLPISFKLGVIVTLLLVLTAMSLKGLIIGFIILLLILANTNTYSKLWGAPKAHITDLNKEIHIHVHSLPHKDHQVYDQSPYIYQNWHDSPTTALHIQ